MVLYGIFSFTKQVVYVNIKPSFLCFAYKLKSYFCMTFCLKKFLVVLIFHFINPRCILKISVLALDKCCQQSAKEQMEHGECGVKVCAWEPRPSELEMREVGRATSLKSPGCVMVQDQLVVLRPPFAF